MSLKLKDKNGIILNVAHKSTYMSLLNTGNYVKVEDNKPDEKPDNKPEDTKSKENKK